MSIMKTILLISMTLNTVFSKDLKSLLNENHTFVIEDESTGELRVINGKEIQSDLKKFEKYTLEEVHVYDKDGKITNTDKPDKSIKSVTVYRYEDILFSIDNNKVSLLDPLDQQDLFCALTLESKFLMTDSKFNEITADEKIQNQIVDYLKLYYKTLSSIAPGHDQHDMKVTLNRYHISFPFSKEKKGQLLPTPSDNGFWVCFYDNKSKDSISGPVWIEDKSEEVNNIEEDPKATPQK